MITRVRPASVAFVLLLVSATASLAQQSDTTSSILRAGMKPRTGAVGAQVGYSDIVAGGDYATGARPRFSFEGSFRYVASSHWGWQLSPYYTWAAYGVGIKTPIHDLAFPTERYKDHYLTQIAGADGQLMYLHTRGAWTWHLGAGPALYRVLLENNRKIIKDPVTFEPHRATYLGATAEMGTEHFMKSLSTTSLEWTVAWHAAFAKDDAKFPSGYSDSPQSFEVRFGAHYYYDLNPAKKPGAKPAPTH